MCLYFSERVQPEEDEQKQFNWNSILADGCSSYLGEEPEAGEDGVTHIDANVLPEDLEPHFDEAFNTKLKCIYTGSEPLSHPDENMR